MVSHFRNHALVAFITLTSLLAGCTKVGLSSPPSGSDGTFSDRPINGSPDLYMVTLNTPPIMEVAKKQNGKFVVADIDKNKLLSEQATFVQGLAIVAPQAQILYRFSVTVNAFAIYSSASDANAIGNLPGVRSVTPGHVVARPNDTGSKKNIDSGNFAINSVNFIGADAAHKLGFTGKGVRVGIIDTGADYTHAMLGGSGNPADYASDNPNIPNAAFPNAKIVGGIDLVGSAFDTESADPAKHLPHPDPNPLDEAGHGSHVAGTIAGVGDGVNTYSGVAPNAKIYSIKIFGAQGSTSDASILAGLEYAADPTGQMDPNNHLDVVNMSLGGDWGQAQTLSNVVIKNLTDAGTAVVVAAGNAGPTAYIVGDPGTADDSLTVAASIDGSLVNWQFAAVKFTAPAQPDMKVLLVEGPVSEPVAKAGNVTGTLVDIGYADKDLPDSVKAALKGHVALISRGIVSFYDKLARAEGAGAIGAVVYNNDATDPIPMGGDQAVDIPAVMITQAVGQAILAQMQTSPVTIQFSPADVVSQPQLVDTITSFSSQGPRSVDNLLKPEIAGPGQNITSVLVGSGNQGVMMDGTSMATPHLTGSIAVLKQAFPDLSPLELKALAMNTAKVLTANGMDIPITMQGAGRIQLDQAVVASVVAETPSVSLGRVQLESAQSIKKTITLRNLTKKSLSLTISTTSTNGMAIVVAKSVTIPAAKTVDIPVAFNITMQDVTSPVFELDGRIYFKDGTGKIAAQIPALAVRTEASQIVAQGGVANGGVEVGNGSPNSGFAMAFNLIGVDASKPVPTGANAWMNRDCDLESAGYRIITKNNQQVVQFAFKLYQPVTTWYVCAVSALIDSKGTGVADQEIAGVVGGGLSGVLKTDADIYQTVLLDAAKARAIRLAYETDLANVTNDPHLLPPDYTPAVLTISPMRAYQQSTIAVIEAPLSMLNLTADGKLNVMLASQSETNDTFDGDKYLGDPLKGSWFQLPTKAADQSFTGMDEIDIISPSGAKVNVTKGTGAQKLVLYYPMNEFAINHGDGQEQVIGN